MNPTDIKSGLTSEALKQIIKYDPQTGKFVWLNKSLARTDYQLFVNGIKENPYLLIRINKRNFLCHRLAWLYITGKWPSDMLDHINGDKSDNRFCNLREATRSQNCGNHHRLRPTNTSGFRGVSPRKENGKWRATIRLEGKIKSLGTFDSPEVAKAAYDKAFKEKHGEFANTSI